MTERKDDGPNKPEHDDFERTVNLKSPLISSDEFDATLQLDNLEDLLAEAEASSAEVSGYGDEGDKPDEEENAREDAYDLDIQSGELHELDAFKVETEDPEHGTEAMGEPAVSSGDESVTPASEAPSPTDQPKRVELTEEQFAATTPPDLGVPEAETPAPDQPPKTSKADAAEEPAANETTVASETSVDAAPASSADEPRDIEASSMTPAPAATETHDMRREASEDQPRAEPSQDEPRTPRSAMPALLLGLLALGVAGASLWMNMRTTDRLEKLEQRLAAMEHHPAVSISRQVNAQLNTQLKTLTGQVRELGERLEKHLKTVAQTAQPKPAQTTSAPPTAKAGNGAAASRKPTMTPATPATPHATKSTATSGAWVVNLTSLSDPRAARAEVARLKRMGIAVERIEIKAGGRTWQRIRVPGFPSRAAAEQARKSLERKLHIRDAWVSRR